SPACLSETVLSGRHRRRTYPRPQRIQESRRRFNRECDEVNMHIELENGQWVEFRDIEKLTNGQRKPFMRAIASLPTDAEGKPNLAATSGDQILAVGEALLVSLVESRSFGRLPGENADARDDPLAPDYDRPQA